MGHFNPTHVPSAEVIARETRVLELRRSGASFQTIAAIIGISDRSDAHKIYKRALARTLQEPADDIRRLEADRLDALQTGVWTRALQGHLGAVDRVLSIMQRRARLLGLDHADGIAERALQLEADRIRLIAIAVGRVFDELDLDPVQRERGTAVLLAELRAHAEDEPDLEQLTGPVVSGQVDTTTTDTTD